MKNWILLFIMISASLFSCKNENKQETSPEENRQIQEETEKVAKAHAAIQDTIEVHNPLPGEMISSPLEIEGRARGTWYFEGSFGIKLLDEKGDKIAVVPAEAQDPWMTEDWVDFSARLEFEHPASEKGFLVLEKANPSALEKHDRELRVKISFVPSP